MIPRITITEPSGPVGAPLLVLGPSLGTTTILWDAAAVSLRDHYRVAAFDPPGHGTSPVAREPFTSAELAAGVLSAIDALGVEKFFYAGVSLSGAVGLELLLSVPERVIAASTICSGAKIGTADGWNERTELVRSQGTAALVVGSATRWFAPGSIEKNPEITGRLLHALRDADDESYALCCQALAGYDVRDRLGEIRTPVLALWGQYDEVTPESSAAEIASGVQHGRIDGIENASHLAPAEQPAAVASALIDFFEGAR